MRHRMGPLIALATVGGGAMGLAAVLAAAHPLVLRWLDVVVVGGILAALVGALVGLLSSPVVYLLLRQKNLWHALVIVYGMTLVVVVITTRLFTMLSAPLAGPPALVIACVFVAYVLPNVVSRHGPGYCRVCDYDLRHARHATCPECGAGVGNDGESHRPSGPFSRSVRALRLVVPCLLLAIAAGTLLSQWISRARFTPAKHATIAVGMTREEVRSILGPPDTRPSQWSQEIWTYDQEHWIISIETYFVYFFNERVIRTGVDKS